MHAVTVAPMLVCVTNSAGVMGRLVCSGRTAGSGRTGRASRVHARVLFTKGSFSRRLSHAAQHSEQITEDNCRWGASSCRHLYCPRLWAGSDLSTVIKLLHIGENASNP